MERARMDRVGTIPRRPSTAKQAYGQYLNENGKDIWSGRVDSNHRPPGPEACGLPYLLEYKANIFVKNFILSTKSTLVGGQLGGLF